MEISGNAASFVVKGILFLLRKLLTKPLEMLSKFLFQEAYKISTLHKSHRDMRGLWRKDLDDYVSYEVNCQRLFLGKEQSNCTLWIKAKDKEGFGKITICVTASLKTLRYQSVVTIYDVSDIPSITAIPSIPLREIEVRGNEMYLPYEEISVELLEVFDTKKASIDLRYKIKKTMHPIDNLEAAMGLRKSNVYKWGRWWNLDFLEMEKNEFTVIFRGLAFHARFHQSKLIHFWTIVAWLAQKKWFLEICFWAKNLVTARQLKKCLHEYLEDFKDSTKVENKSF